MHLDLSARGWGRVVVWTALGTLLCFLIALYVSASGAPPLDETQRLRALLIDVLIPVIFAVPILFLVTSRLRQLAIARQELRPLARTDSLTDLPDRGTFLTLVEAYLDGVVGQETGGALLLVDADNFKAINDSFGHDSGDDALRVMAARIRGAVRRADFVGRIGGEEFGILLPRCTLIQAQAVAERIRSSIGEAGFGPDIQSHLLSVSIGGAAFDRRLPLGELFRLADQQLYLAKRNGRNRISVAPVIDYQTIPKAAA